MYYIETREEGFQIDEIEIDDNLQSNDDCNGFFLFKVFAISVILLFCTVTQWALIVEIESCARFINHYNYLGLLLFFICFVVLMFYIYFFEYIIRASKVILYVYTSVVVEIASTVLIKPLTDSDLRRDLLFSAALASCVLVFSFILSMTIQCGLDYDSDFIVLWTVRYYLFSTMGIQVVMAIDSPYGEAWFTFFAIMFMSTFFIIFAQSVGRQQIYNSEQENLILYTILSFLNLVTLFSNNLLFMEKIRLVKDNMF